MIEKSILVLFFCAMFYVVYFDDTKYDSSDIESKDIFLSNILFLKKKIDYQRRVSFESVKGENGKERKFNPKLEMFKNNEKYKQCVIDESDQYYIDHKLINKWEKSWEEKEFNVFRGLLEENGAFQKFSIKYKILEDSPVWDLGGKDAEVDEFMLDVTRYLNSFIKIDSVNVFTVKYLIEKDWRQPLKTMPVRRKLNIILETRGVIEKGSKVVDKGNLTINLKRTKGFWQIEHLKFDTMNRFYYNKSYSYQKSEEQKSFHGISHEEASKNYTAVDGNVLSLKQSNGLAFYNFDDQTSQLSSKAFQSLKIKDNIRYIKFHDFNHDGKKDLFVITFNKNKNYLGIIIYKKNDNKYQKVYEDNYTNVKLADDLSIEVLVADFNGNGYDDILIPFSEKSGKILHLKNLSGYIENRGYFLFKKKNNENFDQTLEFSDKKYSLVNWNKDSLSDLFILDPSNPKFYVYVNNNGSELQKVIERKFNVKAQKRSQITWEDLNNDGSDDLILSQFVWKESERFLSSCKDNWNAKISDKIKNNFITKGLYIFLRQEDNLIELELEKIKHNFYAIRDLGFFDFNKDGYQDIYIARGGWSGEIKYADISSLITRYEFLKLAALLKNMPSSFDDSKLYTSIVENEKILYQTRDKKVWTSYSAMGFVKDIVLKNHGDGTFSEFDYFLNIDETKDSMGVYMADINDDGTDDLILESKNKNHSVNKKIDFNFLLSEDIANEQEEKVAAYFDKK
ncbi:MAG: hypothetical protein CMP11_04075 [Zetaproteobacteria bacterium]|nr:hypothetical protein [Pseudobdellovibrionaceae bacterium]